MSKYQDKDIQKFKICNKLISRGVVNSSSARYAYEGVGDIAPINVNCGQYVKQDVVGISVNGKRYNAVGVDKKELYKALDARVTIVKDNRHHTQRSFNTGERELEKILIDNDYSRYADNKFRAIWMYKGENNRYYCNKCGVYHTQHDGINSCPKFKKGL